MEYNDKQLQILTAAEELFATKGFDGTSVRDIAKVADINVAMISYYFGSKEKLLEAIFLQRTDHLKMQIESMLENQSLTPLQKVYTLIDSYLEKLIERPNFHKLIMSMQVTQNSEGVISAIYESKKRNHDLIKKLIQEGQKAGKFKKNIDISLMMSTMVGTANHLMASNTFFRQMQNMEHLSDDEFRKTMKKKLSLHLKTLFKAILTNEAQ